MRFFTQKKKTFSKEKNINKLTNETKRNLFHIKCLRFTDELISLNKSVSTSKKANLNKAKQNYLSRKSSSNQCGPRAINFSKIDCGSGSISTCMYNRASALNLSLHIVLLLYILSLRKAEKDLSQGQDVTGRVPSILKAVLIIGKYGKLMKFSVVLTLSGRQVLL